MLELHSFIKDISNFFAELDNSFWMLKEYFNFLCSSQCQGQEYDTLLSLILHYQHSLYQTDCFLTKALLKHGHTHF